MGYTKAARPSFNKLGFNRFVAFLSPHEGSMEFLREYEAKLKFPDGLGVGGGEGDSSQK